MKRNFILAFLALVGVACTTVTDDNSDTHVRNMLDAKWHLQEITYHDGYSEVLSDCQKQSYWTFAQDNKLYIHQFSDNDTPCTDSNPNNYSLDYTLLGNRIAYTVPDDNISGGFYVARYTLIQINSTKLQLTAIYELDGLKAGDPGYDAAPFEGDIPPKYQWSFIFSR